jgi:hypothetical protein
MGSGFYYPGLTGTCVVETIEDERLQFLTSACS